MKIVLMQGVPGSGKSTIVKNEYVPRGFQVVCKDNVRFALGVEYGQCNRAIEPVVSSVTETTIRANMEAGFDIVVDETHTKIGPVKRIQHIAMDYGYDFGIHLVPCYLADAKKRRCYDGRFPEHVIDRMHCQLEFFLEEYAANYHYVAI